MNRFFSRMGFGLLSFFVGSAAWAFPSNVRHGYPNCTACHVSPGGGGVLTAYGRELSRELQSTKGGEAETAFLYGAVKPPDWLDAGGDLRYIEVIQDTPSEIEGRGFWMQADAEAAVHIGKFAIDGTLGWKGNSEGLADDSSVLSRRHYAMVSFTDRYTVRAGRFFPMFGLMQPEHEDATRMGLGFDQGEESYNLEFSEQDENGSFFVTPIFGKLRKGHAPDEKGFAVSKNFMIGGNSRIGLSGLYGKTSDQPAFESRILLGPNAIVNLGQTVFWLVEADFERREIGGTPASETGFYQYQKLSYAPVQGLILSGRQDFQRRVIGDARTSVVTLGPTLDWYPRPHFDLQMSISKAMLPEGDPGYWVYTGMFHYYL
jgi:hypothetical protein